MITVPRNLAELFSDPVRLGRALSFAERLYSLKVVTDSGEIPIIKSDGSQNVAIDLRGITANNATPTGSLPSVVGAAGKVLVTDGATASWGPATPVSGAVLYMNGLVLAESGNMTFDGQALTIQPTFTNSTFRVGDLELQCYTDSSGNLLGNAAFGVNAYFDGTNVRYRRNGTLEYVQFDGGEIWLRSAVSGSAGAVATVTTWVTLKNDGTLVFSKYGTGALQTNSIGTVSSSTLGPSVGGTGLTSFVKGDLLVATSSTTLARLPVGADGNVLSADSTQTAGVKWGSTGAGSGTVTSVAASVPSFLTVTGSPVTTSGTLAIAYNTGTALPTANGGTGLTAYTSGRIPYWSSTSAWSSSANLLFDGTTVTIAGSLSTSTLRVGVLEMQSFGTNNCAFADNIFFNGTNNVYRVTGFGEYIQLDGGEIWFRTAPSGSAGATATVTTQVTIGNTGNVLIRGTLIAKNGAITVTGSRAGNVALASLLTSMATIGLIVDSTTA